MYVHVIIFYQSKTTTKVNKYNIIDEERLHGSLDINLMGI